jgi:hypothetical protein
VQLEIIPEPSAEERAAIELALATLSRDQFAVRSAWWSAGVVDSPDDDELALPTTSPGP